ncbi:MAG TPA: FGGY family carbohydrate kinase [Tepidisphaeraceae bacterium]|nr:FGGY family carbohydrate kinase [Tepidisphaeraceae bacterium]
MSLLALDIGSSSIKAAILRGAELTAEPPRYFYATRHDGPRAEVDPDVLLATISQAARDTAAGSSIDAIALSVMSPAWVAMDSTGRAITPIVTHQDRRSVVQAKEIEAKVGKERHLQLAGNRPIPGGISSTTYAWFKPQLQNADLIGHLNTFLIRRWTGNRVIDPGNASFTGFFSTLDQSGWCDELCCAVGISRALLPDILSSNQIAGRLNASAAKELALPQGTPVFTGAIDTSAAMLATGAAVGQLFHMCGSTDVLALCTDRPKPNERLLTRALGIGRRWMSVSTIAAAGSSLDWIRREMFRDMSEHDFQQLAGRAEKSAVKFDPYLAGDRMTIDQPSASFSNLTLSATRNDMLGALVTALAEASSARLGLFPPDILPTVFISGGGAFLADMMHRGWPGSCVYREIDEASLRGLWSLTLS